MRLLSLFASLLLALPAAAQTWPERLSQTVSDNIEIIDSDTEARIRQTLEQMREEEGIEMAVVTIDALSDFDGGDDVTAYAQGLLEAWDIGGETGDDGVLVLFVRDARELRVELGPAWPPSAQEEAGRVIQAYFVPDFRSGAYGRGLETGTAELARRLAALDPAEVEGQAGGQTTETTEGTTATEEPATTTDVAQADTEADPPAGTAPEADTAADTAATGDAAGTAGTDETPAAEETAATEETPATEETVAEETAAAEETVPAPADADEGAAESGGISWLWLIAVAAAGVLGFKLLARAPKCPECGKRGVTVTRTTLTPATETAEGQEKVVRDCPNCDYHAEEVRTLPRKDAPKEEQPKESKPAPAAKTDDPAPPKGGGASGKW